MMNQSRPEDHASPSQGRSRASNVPAFSMPFRYELVPGGATHGTTSVSLWKLQPTLISQAVTADLRLHYYSKSSYFLPSLSVLASAAFGRLTGCDPNAVKEYCDGLLCSYIGELIELSEDQIWTTTRLLNQLQSITSAVDFLKQHAQSNTGTRRPCGYVFKRGDIAWNCRTCQTDPTCVICDTCFRNSDHQGHEVYFHRTSPGGCCDCGDDEAWNINGCCPDHKPTKPAQQREVGNDVMEAVKMSAQGYAQGVEAVQKSGLPPLFLAALGVVVGAAVQAIVEAMDGSGIGADPTQWRLRWADEACKIRNGCVNNQDYFACEGSQHASPKMFTELQEPLPEGYVLHLRLHNDDVHTFDEVIDALHEPRRRGSSTEPEASLVPQRESAMEMTHHVDADGQVTVKTYSSVHGAMQGFKRLKSRGLHCAVVSSAQVAMELRARNLLQYLTDISSAHPAAAAVVTHALVHINPLHEFGGIRVSHQARTIPFWVWPTGAADNLAQSCRKVFQTFPPQMMSSYLTFEEAELLHGIAVSLNPSSFADLTDAPATFYSNVPYRLCQDRYRKSPHALWGTLPSCYSDPLPLASKHPLLHFLTSGQHDLSIPSNLTELVYIVDTDLRKQQEADRLTTSVFPHKLPGLNMISGIGTLRQKEISDVPPPLPSPMEWRHLLATSSFRVPSSPLLLLLLFDPYPTKQVRAALHALFLSLLTDSRFRSRFASAIGVSYRPLTTLFCGGVGTEADTPLHFTVQIFTAGSLVRALGSGPATALLLLDDSPEAAVEKQHQAEIGVFCSPIAHTIVRCIHTNLLGATKEVNMILNNTGRDDDSLDETANGSRNSNDALLPALTYVAGEHPLLTPLPAAPDDGFLDSRSTRHKRLPHLLRDLEYVVETPGTSLRLLLPQPSTSPTLVARDDPLSFASVYARMLRLGQGMDPQKRKISGGHVEYEQNRWLEAFGLSLNFAGTRDALAESPSSSSSFSMGALKSPDGSSVVRDAVGHLITALLREIKFWLYREGMLETGLLAAPAVGAMEIAQAEALQRSTLHLSGNQFEVDSSDTSLASSGVLVVALACATAIKMTEAQLSLIENALKAEDVEKLHLANTRGASPFARTATACTGPVMGDWLRVPHSPLAGDSLSFHLPLHRALAKCVKSLCGNIISLSTRQANPGGWWKIPVLDGDVSSEATVKQHPLVPLIRSTLRSSNCRVVWSSGPDCSTQEAQRRRNRARTVSANIAVAKIIHSIADHPIRCIAAAQQIERHLWARNGSSVAGMAMNYSSTPLCRSFRDLDILMAQLSASGMSCGLGARRVFGLLLSRFSMDGYLCDPEKKSQAVLSSGGTSYGAGIWVNPPRLQDPDHAVVLSESFFSTLCVLVSELPPPPPTSAQDDLPLRQVIRRELVHALAVEARSHSEAMTAASAGISRREETDGGSASSGATAFRSVFTEVLSEVANQKTQRSSRASTGPPTFELKSSCCDEYDPTFFHLRRQEHQHAMDAVARLRKLKQSEDKEASEGCCLPLVCAPPKAHPRFLPCRLLLHLQAMDAAIRRSLLFALTGGSWLPPPEPLPEGDKGGSDEDMEGVKLSAIQSSGGDVPVTTFARRLIHSRSPSGTPFPMYRRTSSGTDPIPFSQEVVAASSVSFLEVLQLLTLQVHTLEECAALHRTLPDLDDESRALSASLSINSYLGRLVVVPESLLDCWALRPHPDGPLQSKGSGERRGSILGLLIALYEHRADHSSLLDAEGSGDGADDGHGGARTLATSGLKWLLRFMNALVEGAPSVGAATKSATSGVPIQPPPSSVTSMGELGCSSWTIDDEVRSTIRSMLANLPDLWPEDRPKSSPSEKHAVKSKEVGKAAQKRAMELMKRKQDTFAASISPSDRTSAGPEKADSDSDLCIICRCDDTDGENNGPLGYLGHVQRSRVAQIRAAIEGSNADSAVAQLYGSYRVVGHMGCQLRETDSMDSKPLTCLPKGSVVTVLRTKVSDEYDVLSRRVLVRHVVRDSNSSEDVVTEGWASVQSSQGYVILSPLSTLCYTNSSWGGTRPIIRHCGHAAHLKCVETHTLSLHQRAAGDQPYDGRFAANISDGEFLCPLCKQLSNILIPRDSYKPRVGDSNVMRSSARRTVHAILSGERMRDLTESDFTGMARRALKDFGSHLYNAMNVPWERSIGSRRKKQAYWNHSIQKWDFEDDDDGSPFVLTGLKGVLRLLRQQLIAWASIGHSAASSEAGARSIEDVLPFGVSSETHDPWNEFRANSKDTHPSVLELKRTLTAACGLLEVFCLELKEVSSVTQGPGEAFFVGALLADILEGRSWLSHMESPTSRDFLSLWVELTSLTASMPCHVARDAVLPLRCEARATAAAMWALKGIGSNSESMDVPPAPLAINRLIEAGQLPVPRDWGTMNPFIRISGDLLQPPFRPGIASSYLYKPLLVWDMCTLSAGVLSSVLANNPADLPTSSELLHISRLLVIGRLVQILITPYGFEVPDELDMDDEECWSEEELNIEGIALNNLLVHCRSLMKSADGGLPSNVSKSFDDATLASVLAGVGQSLLPFCRSLILMLRACSSAIKDRQAVGEAGPVEPNAEDRILNQCLVNSDLMSCQDGFHFVKALGGPAPSALQTSEWKDRIDRWLQSAVGFEVHHGSIGKSIVPSTSPVNSSQISPERVASAPPLVATPKTHELIDNVDSTASDDMEVDDVDDRRRNGPFAVDLMEEDDDLELDVLSEAEEMVDFPGMVGVGPGVVALLGSSPSSVATEGHDSDDESSAGTDARDPDREFAHVSRSPVLPYQPGVLGINEIGPGRLGAFFEYTKASSVMADLSHLGTLHRKDCPSFTLIRLPKSFVELYNVVNKIKGRDDALVADESEETGSAETAICLLSGKVMRSGSARRSFSSRAARPPGACTLHARRHGSGIGIFFLVQKCTILLMHNNKSAYSPSIYVDEHGEEDPGLRRGRPLLLNEARYRALELLWRQQGIPREVAQIRSTSDRVIRDNWY